MRCASCASTVRVRAEIRTLRAYSAHADRSGSARVPRARGRARVASIFLVHGDEDTALAFADTLREHGHGSVIVPEPLASYELSKRS